MMKTSVSSPIQLLTLSFDLPLRRKELPKWRGAFNQLAANCQNEIFHNHANHLPDQTPLYPIRGGYHYRHPLVQYRIQQQKAALVAINEGIEAVHQVLSNHDWQLHWHNTPRTLRIEEVHINTDTFRLSETLISYRIPRWIALNQANYEKWQQCKNLTERADLLERVLTAQLLALFTTFNWRLPFHLEVYLQEIHKKYPVNTHKNSMLSFDVSFTTNVSIPKGLAIGRSVSLGHGEVFTGYM